VLHCIILSKRSPWRLVPKIYHWLPIAQLKILKISTLLIFLSDAMDGRIQGRSAMDRFGGGPDALKLRVFENLPSGDDVTLAETHRFLEGLGGLAN
jgi:hypothetical protein